MCIIKKSVEHSFFVHNDEKKIYVNVFVKKSVLFDDNNEESS